MPKRSSNASRRYHDRVARQYDSIYDDDPFWAFHDELTWRLIKPHVPTDLSSACADLGCGTGKWGLRLLKSGFATTFLDSSAAMIEQVRAKLDGPRAQRATLVVGDIVSMPQLISDAFGLILAMGDPLSICSDPNRATQEFSRICKPGGIVIATADNKLAAIDHFVERGSLDALEKFVQTGQTTWLTQDERERFELTTFTIASLRKTFERNGFEVLSVAGKTVVPARHNKRLFEAPNAIERLLQVEKELSKDSAAAARASHLQIVAKKSKSL